MSEYTDAVDRGTQGMEAISSGDCPGCEQCAEMHGITADEHRAAWHSCSVPDDDAGKCFSWSACGICGSSLGGDRYVWHWIDPNDPKREINHERDMCSDCVLYLANGDEPESWRSR